MRSESEILAEFILRSQEDALYFVRNAFSPSPEPTWQQEEILRSGSEESAQVAVASGHGIGKSTVFAWLALRNMSVYEESKTAITAPTGHQLNDVIWSELRKWKEHLLDYFKNDLEIMKAEIRSKSKPNVLTIGRTGSKDNPEALQGFHSSNMLFLIDEASGIPDKVFEVAEGSLSTKGAKVIMAANPTRNTGFFYNAFKKDTGRWKTFYFSSEDSDNVSETYVKRMESEYGRDSDIFRVRVLGQFPTGGDIQFISSGIVEEAMSRKAKDNSLYKNEPIILGVDVAYFGNDRSTIVLRQGQYCEKLLQKHNIEITDLVGHVAEISRERGVDAIFVDVTGVGAGVVSNLRALGLSPIAVSFGGSSSISGYLNKRAECWGKMRDWLKNDYAILPRDDKLRDELCSPDYSFTIKGDLKLESKESMKSRGLKSPDVADALALTFATPVFGKNAMNQLNRVVVRTCKDYDPFSSNRFNNIIRMR